MLSMRACLLVGMAEELARSSASAEKPAKRILLVEEEERGETMAEGMIRILNDAFSIPLSKQSQGRVLEDVTAHACGSWLKAVPDVLRGHIRHKA
ncbi:hypothetical protein KCU81_g431, partial [Aureobasidium melanogenum]